MRARHSVMLRLMRAREDRGSSLVAVIGTAAVIALTAAVMVSAVVFAIGQTTAARAGVDSKAAAESGLEAAAASVAAGACWVGGANTSTSPVWKAQIQRLVSPSADPALDASWVNGCPSASAPPAPGTPFRVISTGRADARGAGNSSGDVRTMVAQFTVAQRPPNPEFNQAIFGDVQTYLNSNLDLNGSDGDILTDKFTCSTNMDADGSVLVNAPSTTSLSTLNTDCIVREDLITSGSLNCPANGSVHGDVVVGGNLEWNTTCHAYQDVWVAGNMSCPTAGAVIDGDLTVYGNLTMNSTCQVGGNIYVGGNITISNTVTYPGNIWVKGNIAGNGGLTLKANGSIRVGGALTSGLTLARVQGNPTTVPDATLPKPAAPDMTVWFPPGDPKLEFPKVRATDARWSGWVQRSWVTDLLALRTGGPTGTGVCDQTWVSGSSNFSGPLNVMTPTIYDLTKGGSTSCSGAAGLGGGLTVRLYADAVLFVKGATFKTNFRVESGDGNKHSLYVIEAWPTTMTSCASPVSGINGITFNTAGFSQGPNAQVMIYTPGAVQNSNPNTVLNGQLYACQVTLSNKLVLNFSPATSNAGGSGGRSFVVTERFRLDDQGHELS